MQLGKGDLRMEFKEGTCRGGPLDGQPGQSRFPKGFLLVDKPKNLCWIYEWDNISREFYARDNEPMTVELEGRLRAADEHNYDVVAAPWGSGAP
jgi:hypothetical protein